MNVLKVEVNVHGDLWVATAPAVRCSETGESYDEALTALRSTLSRVLDDDVELDVTVYGID